MEDKDFCHVDIACLWTILMLVNFYRETCKSLDIKLFWLSKLPISAVYSGQEFRPNV